MKTSLVRPLLAVLLLAAAPALPAQITVGNVRAAQRAGTKLVDIDYDLTGIATPCTVWLEISADGGATWAVPATTTSGAVGTGVTPGTDLRITWNAGLDWNAQTSAQTRFRIKVSDLLPDLADFAAIPGGNFQMGDNLDGMANAPVHTVNVSAFYIGKKEVTKAEWDAVRTWGSTHGYYDLAAGAGSAADHPVQTVSWWDVVKWCNAKSEQEGLTPCYYTDTAQTAVFKAGTPGIDNTMVKWTANGYRLPTEAEWEKAARGGLVGKRYPLGDSITTADANYSSGGTVAVGGYAANGYGLFDAAGNVWEWCWDWYDGDYSSSVGTDPHGPAAGSNRVLRGGGWNDAAIYVRCAPRNTRSPGDTAFSRGFRLARGQ
jgi:formylglycine-generating enzyme required for sulfatase activity